MGHSVTWTARTAASPNSILDLNIIIILDLISSGKFSCARCVLWTRHAAHVASPVLAGAPGSCGVSTIPLRKKPCAKPRAVPVTCKAEEPRGESPAPVVDVARGAVPVHFTLGG